VASMKSKSNSLARFSAQAAMRAENEELGIEEAIGSPAHAYILAHAEEISGWLSEQHLCRERQKTFRTRCMRGYAEKRGVHRLQN